MFLPSQLFEIKAISIHENESEIKVVKMTQTKPEKRSKKDKSNIPLRKKNMSDKTHKNTTLNDKDIVDLWNKVRKRRVYQLAQFSMQMLRELCARFLIDQPPSKLAIPKPPLSMTDIVKNSARLELVTYLAKLFERCYMISVDPNQTKEIRLEHLSRVKEMCCAFDEKFTKTVLMQCNQDNVKRKRSNLSNSNADRNEISYETANSRNNNSSIDSSVTSVREHSQNNQSRKTTQEQELQIQKQKQKQKEKEEELKKYENMKFINELKSLKEKANDHLSTTFQPDLNRVSHSVHARKMKAVVKYNVYNQINSPNDKSSFFQRLETWDPFWEVKSVILPSFQPHITPDFSNLGGIQMAPVEKCIISSEGDNKYSGEPIRGCVKFMFCIPKKYQQTNQGNSDQPTLAWGEKRKTDDYKNGEYALLLRMLPRIPPKDTYKADIHTWPKGTIVEMNSKIIPYMKQKRQQIHDESIWKGNSYPLDLTPYCNVENIGGVIKVKSTQSIQIGSMEYDSNCPYYIQVAICEYIHPEHMMNIMMKRLPKISYDDALLVAKKYCQNQTICIDDSSDESDSDMKTNMNDISFTLNCPISMKPMTIPVRGKNCKHLQCYDLESFLLSNSFPSGRRWRCIGCDSLLNLTNLIQCGLFTKMVEIRAKLLTKGKKDKSKVNFRANGKWRLEEEKKEFNTTKIRGDKRKLDALHSSSTVNQINDHSKDVIFLN